jgi:hypothetical protein
MRVGRIPELNLKRFVCPECGKTATSDSGKDVFESPCTAKDKTPEDGTHIKWKDSFEAERAAAINKSLHEKEQ